MDEKVMKRYKFRYKEPITIDATDVEFTPEGIVIEDGDTKKIAYINPFTHELVEYDYYSEDIEIEEIDEADYQWFLCNFEQFKRDEKKKEFDVNSLVTSYNILMIDVYNTIGSDNLSSRLLSKEKKVADKFKEWQSYE